VGRQLGVLALVDRRDPTVAVDQDEARARRALVDSPDVLAIRSSPRRV